MPIGSTSPFRPSGTVGMTATTTGANIALAGGGETAVITNTSSSIAYIRFGSDPSVTATTNDMPVLPNDRIILAINNLITYASAILQAGSGTVIFSRGDGSVI
jgi:hypothetical protein